MCHGQNMAEPPVTIQHASEATVNALTYTCPVFLFIYVHRKLNRMICGMNRIISDMNGPPNVELNSRSAPGPISRKNGIYSTSTIRNTPPAITNAFFSQQIISEETELPDALSCLICPNILALFKRKNSANIGMYTRNWINLSRVNILKNGHMNRKSSLKTAVSGFQRSGDDLSLYFPDKQFFQGVCLQCFKVVIHTISSPQRHDRLFFSISLWYNQIPQ